MINPRLFEPLLKIGLVEKKILEFELVARTEIYILQARKKEKWRGWSLQLVYILGLTPRLASEDSRQVVGYFVGRTGLCIMVGLPDSQLLFP